MLFLLRKIRRKLIRENKFTAYLLYAIGEIFLVVIGILIAVKINNLNNQSSLQSSEKLSLVRLAEDLENDLSRYEFLSNRLKEHISRNDSTLNLIHNQTTVEDRIDIISVHQISFYLIESNTTTYNEMLNTGRLYSMNDKELRSAIIEYYRYVTKWSTYIEKDNQQLRTMMSQHIFNDYWVVQKKIKQELKIDLKKYPWISAQHSREMKDIEHLVYSGKELFEGSNQSIKFLKRKCRELIAKIKTKTSSI